MPQRHPNTITQLGSAPILKIAVLVLVLLLILYAFYWVFGRFIGVIRWALDRIAYALGVILFSAVVVSGVFKASLASTVARAGVLPGDTQRRRASQIPV
jgi:hypothetical protein